MKLLTIDFIILMLLFQTATIAQTTFIERQQVTTDFAWRTPNNICIADLDGDGDEDILVADYKGIPEEGRQIMWHKNLDNRGTFGNAIYIQSENYIMMTAIHPADLDGDGDMDFIASDDSELMAWFENLDGQGNFGAQDTLTTLSWHANGIRTADFDLDGDMDIVGVSYNDQYAVFWFENLDGNGTFSDIKPIYSSSENVAGGSNLVVADMDGDGDTDIVALVHESGISKAYYFENLGNGDFQNPQVIGTFSGGESIIVADIDNDNDEDVIVPATNGLLAFINTNGLAEFGSARILASTYTGVVFSDDLDNDGDIDLLWIDHERQLILYTNDGSGNFHSHSTVSNTINAPGVICTADFDDDGDRDILIGAGRVGDAGPIIWFENTCITTGIELDQAELPQSFRFDQNYPNPFNSSTTIPFSLQKPEYISLKIYNLTGQLLATLVDGVRSAGKHQVQWQADRLPGGIYLVRLKVGVQMETMKLVLQK